MLLTACLDEPFAIRAIFWPCRSGSVFEDFKELLGMEYWNGVRLNTERIDRIREDNGTGGHRIQTTVKDVRIAVAIDFGFGDATEPGIETFDYPVLPAMLASRLMHRKPSLPRSSRRSLRWAVQSHERLSVDARLVFRFREVSVHESNLGNLCAMRNLNTRGDTGQLDTDIGEDAPPLQRRRSTISVVRTVSGRTDRRGDRGPEDFP